MKSRKAKIDIAILMVEELENQGSNIGMLWDENLTAGNAEPVQWKYWNINLIELQSGQLIGAVL